MNIHDNIPDPVKLAKRLKKDGLSTMSKFIGIVVEKTTPSWGQGIEFGVRMVFVKNPHAGKPCCSDYITYQKQKNGSILRGSYFLRNYKIEGEYHEA